MNTKQTYSSKLLWLGGLVLVLVAGTAMAGDHYRGVRVYGSLGFYGAPVVVSPPVAYYNYSTPYYPPAYYAQPYYTTPYYAPSVIVGGYWGGRGSYYAAPWGRYGYSRRHR